MSRKPILKLPSFAVIVRFGPQLRLSQIRNSGKTISWFAQIWR